MSVVVLIPFFDDVDLMADAVESAWKFNCPVAAADGAWALFPGSRERWRSAESSPGIPILLPPESRPWESEAAKRTALVDFARQTFPNHDWALFLDTDERLDHGVISGKEISFPDTALWANVHIYRPDDEPNAHGECRHFSLPRLVRLDGKLEFRPPRDYELYHDDEHIAYLDGEPVPTAMADRFVDVPWDLLRIRHERRLRSPERAALNSRYQQAREAAHGV